MLQPSCHNRFGLSKGFYVAIRHFYAATKFGQDQGFLVTTEFGQGEEILCRDRVA